MAEGLSENEGRSARRVLVAYSTRCVPTNATVPCPRAVAGPYAHVLAACPRWWAGKGLQPSFKSSALCVIQTAQATVLGEHDSRTSHGIVVRPAESGQAHHSDVNRLRASGRSGP
ncbi:hypothetical protein XAB3213_270024 [Xanthomonas citri pv. bilvae]|nr:hypothetical protein XAB3213_270024 [Xanthomonas citri pv. bilvae]